MGLEVNKVFRPQGLLGLSYTLHLPILTFQEEGDPPRILRLVPWVGGGEKRVETAFGISFGRFWPGQGKWEWWGSPRSRLEARDCTPPLRPPTGSGRPGILGTF